MTTTQNVSFNTESQALLDILTDYAINTWGIDEIHDSFAGSDYFTAHLWVSENTALIDISYDRDINQLVVTISQDDYYEGEPGYEGDAYFEQSYVLPTDSPDTLTVEMLDAVFEIAIDDEFRLY